MRINKEKELLLSYELASSLLNYDPDTGIISWKAVSGARTKIGMPAGSKQPNGYLRISVNKNRFLAHRLAWLLYYKEWPLDIIDHIDGNKSNNKIENLRVGTILKNNYNTGITVTNTSGYKGVSWNSANNKYIANINVKGKKVYLGMFSTSEEASEAYNKAAKELHGEFYKDTRI